MLTNCHKHIKIIILTDVYSYSYSYCICICIWPHKEITNVLYHANTPLCRSADHHPHSSHIVLNPSCVNVKSQISSLLLRCATKFCVKNEYIILLLRAYLFQDSLFLKKQSFESPLKPRLRRFFLVSFLQ
jgi:hypothetical protein